MDSSLYPWYNIDNEGRQQPTTDLKGAFTMKSFYHDLRTDDILTEREYDKRMEECFSASLVYFGEYSSRSEALADLNGKYSYLKNNSYWNPAM